MGIELGTRVMDTVTGIEGRLTERRTHYGGQVNYIVEWAVAGVRNVALYPAERIVPAVEREDRVPMEKQVTHEVVVRNTDAAA